ncbi:TRPM3 [Mytilus edulis]|uniref:TRPM3 n=1 Tax=Mytilus edulis TaxID=6550 RepID=A0A8S3S949_MYTED|nr:TRPM3 [Mytilus edulis]
MRKLARQKVKNTQYVEYNDTFSSQESMKDGVSDLLESSLVANKPELVMLIVDRMENMQSFVQLYIASVYQKCIWETDEDLPINLIDQRWKQRYAKEENKNKKTNTILVSVGNFIRDLLGDRDFKLYEDIETPEDILLWIGYKKQISIAYSDHPFHHLFVWAVLVNWKEMAMIFWKNDSDYICTIMHVLGSALFASAVLKELAERAHFSNHMDLSISLNENASEFEGNACKLITEMYRKDRGQALKVLVTKVGRYNSTPLAIAYSQKLMKFMAITACQTKLDSIWRGIGVAVFLPILTIQNIGFITIGKNDNPPNQIKPIEIRYKNMKTKSSERDHNDNKRHQDKSSDTTMNSRNLPSVYKFYNAPIVKFIFYMIAYLVFLGIFSTFVLTDMYPLSERSPSVLEYLTWIWTLSLGIEEIRQVR